MGIGLSSVALVCFDSPLPGMGSFSAGWLERYGRQRMSENRANEADTLKNGKSFMFKVWCS